jgi:oligopeptide/dipeptide ABC transporter ATP-binding protein
MTGPASPSDAPLLDVRGLSTVIDTGTTTIRAVDDVSLAISPGETLGLVGESGCGKTTTARSIARLLPPGASITTGQILFDGVDLASVSDRQMRDYRGGSIGFVFQDPSSSLNPVYPIGVQVAEPLRLHLGMAARAARAHAVDLLGSVGIPRPAQRIDDYPFQLSGGMRQRVMIAIALACRPRLLIADEPTTALDVTIQAQILELIAELSREHRTAVLLITHSLGIAAGLCDRIAVMYAGRVVETGGVDALFYRPQMPYSWGLLQALPTVGMDRAARLVPINGSPPDLAASLPGCRFASRCEHAGAVCTQDEPRLTDRGDGHLARCHATEREGGWLS